MTRTVRVEGRGFAGYDVVIGDGLIAHAGRRVAELGFHSVFVVADATVDALHGNRLRAGLTAADVRHAGIRVPPGEASKSFDGLRTVLSALADAGVDRKGAVIALGGGVTGDLAGLAAALWMRGVALIQLPTTLLAQVDSSVGGKTAIDLPQGKNLVGAFHQPRLVLADMDALATLPPRQLRSGWAEALKHGLICDPAYFDSLTGPDAAGAGGDRAALARVVARSVEIKADVVGQDEKEAGARALLNLGHTFGHAIETEQGYGSPDNTNLNHGEAVAVGMVLAARLSADLGMADPADGERLAALLQAYGLPIAIPAGLAPEALLARMRLDKKNQAGRLRLVLWRGIGRAEVVPDIDENRVLAVLGG
jgi:3-dehydroquinate synthase